MVRFRRLGKVLLYGAAILGLLYLGARFYLSSESAAHRVAASLQELLGGSVEVQAVDIGVFAGSTLSGIQVHQPDAAAGERPWIDVGGVTADASALHLLFGQLPENVSLHNPQIILQFDADNHLVTRLPSFRPRPGAVPRFHIDNGHLTLACEGRTPMVIHGVQGVIAGDEAGIHLDGTISDPYWGEWTAGGRFESDSRRVSLDLRSQPTQVTMEKLQGIPFISKSVWEQVQLEGRTPVQLALGFPPPGEGGTLAGVHYRVDLEPADTHVHVSSIDLTAEKARGKVVVEDKVVTLADVVGQSADGEVRVDGTLDFRQPKSDMEFKVNVAGLALHALPPRWRVPRKFDGKLTGRADLRVIVVDGKARTSGGGEGQIDRLRLGPTPLPGKIKLLLHADENGFRFSSPAKSLSSLGALLSVGLMAPPAPRDPVTEDFLPAVMEVPRGIVRGIGWAANEAVDSMGRAGDWLRRLRQPPPAGQEHNYLEADFSLEDVDLAEVVSGLGLSLPFTVAGKLSVEVRLGVPTDAGQDMKAYRAEGTARLSRLDIEGVEFNDVRARVRYAEGVLQLTELRGRIPAASKTGEARDPGTFSGVARLQLFPAGNLSGEVRLEHLPAGRLLSLLPGVKAEDSGEVSGTVQATVAANKLRDLDAWDGSADLLLRELNIENLLSAVPSFPVRVAGRVDGTVRGTLTAARAEQPRLLATQIDLSAPQLRIQGIPARRLHASIDYRGGSGEYQLQGETLGGRFRLEGKLPPLPPPAGPQPAKDVPEKAPAPPPDGRLEFQGIRLSRLWDVFGWQDLVRVQGTVSIDLPFRLEGPQRRPVGLGSFRIAELSWYDEDRADSIQGDLRLDGDRLELRNVTGAVGQGLLAAHIVIPLRRGRGGSFNITLTQVDAARFLPPWEGIGEPIQGPVDVSLRGSIDGELRGGGTVVLTRGKVLGIEVSEWRLPVQFSLALRRGDGELRLSDMSAVVAHGRAMGRAHLTWAPAGRLEGNLRFYDVDLRVLMASTGEASTLAAGRLGGRIDLGGSEILSVNDLTANVSATLSQAQAMKLPVLDQLAPYIRPGISSLTFQGGQLEGNLNRGIFRIRKLTLEGGLVQMMVEGTIDLQGRIDLDVMARTNNLACVPPALRLLGLRLPAAGFLPASLITEATLLLANSTVHLHVTGTVRNPVVQVQPLRLLTEEAVRFFLTRALIPNP
jgi:hypothetical protein